jgi:hypothetical protein
MFAARYTFEAIVRRRTCRELGDAQGASRLATDVD